MRIHLLAALASIAPACATDSAPYEPVVRSDELLAKYCARGCDALDLVEQLRGERRASFNRVEEYAFGELVIEHLVPAGDRDYVGPADRNPPSLSLFSPADIELEIGGCLLAPFQAEVSRGSQLVLVGVCRE